MPPTSAQPESLCVIRLSAIGDCCHTLPVVRTLQAAFPATPITWVIGKTERSLLEGAKGIEFITFDKSLGMAAIFDVRRQLRGRHFPVMLQMHASMRSNLAGAVISAGRRIGFDRARARDKQWLFTNERIPARRHQHVMDGLFEFAEYLGVKDRTLRWDIPVSEADQRFAAELATGSGPLVVISPCSSQRFRNYRNWSIENYINVVQHMQRRHAARIIVTGANTAIENEYAAAITAAGENIINLVGKTSLKQLLAIIGEADLVLCPDSGPAHMAAATGTPVVGLYATSNRHRTGPYFSQQLVADRYPDAVADEFGKEIDALRWGQRVRNPQAMARITLAEVAEKIDTVLDTDYAHPQARKRVPVLEDL
jgi:heptosyltransferase I